MEASKSVFVETFGDSPYVRVLDFFLTFKDFDYSKSQVAQETGVSRVTIEKIWGALARKGFIAKTRVIGRAELYKLNTANPGVRSLLELDFKLSQAHAEEGRKEKAKALA
jgi:biotin operon repressor